MDKRDKKYFLVAFKQDTSVGPIYTMKQLIKAHDRDEAILEYKIRSGIPIGILGSYEVIREVSSKKEDVPTKT